MNSTDPKKPGTSPEGSKSRKRTAKRIALVLGGIGVVASAALPPFFSHFWNGVFDAVAGGPRRKGAGLTAAVFAMQARDIGGFQPLSNKCRRESGPGVRVGIVSRTPNNFGGCCWEQASPLNIPARARVTMKVDLEHDDSVDLKFEEGPFGSPTRTGWLHRGALATGVQAVDESLVDDTRNPIADDLKVARFCVAFVGQTGPSTNKIVIHDVGLVTSETANTP